MTITKAGFLLIPTLLLTISCKRHWGDNDLGDNFSLLEGDHLEDRVIVYCSGRDFGICHAGTAILPVYARHYDNGRYAEYAETAVANDKYIIARTVQVKDQRRNYWIISKELFDGWNGLDSDSAIQAKLIGPLDEVRFKKKIVDLNVDLQF